ncbi:MAG: PQQ-binding-like beta-propeller repeat protein [Verrucomicrobiales bacterium]|nr:PQQ-binding-like beta-propeller repeat protein [Verrucomicrobiales bacterium]
MKWVLAVALAILVTGCDDPASEVGGNGQPKKGGGGGEKVQQDWPLFRRDAQMQGVSKEDLLAPLKLLWEFHPEQKQVDGKKRKRPYPIKATAVIKEGLVYVGSEQSRFFCLDLSDGKLRWEYQSQGPITGPAAVIGEQVYFGCQYGFLYALDCKTGKELWKFEADDKIEGGVNALEVKDEKSGEMQMRLFFGSYDNHLYALDAATGKVVWKYETDNYLVGTPSVVAGEQAAVIVGGCDGLLHVISAQSGKELRNFDVGAYIPNSAAVRDGIAYVSHFGGEVGAYDVTAGEEVWKVVDEKGVEFYASPAVTKDRVYVGGRDKALRCLDRVDGKELWRFSTRRAVDSSAVVCDSALYVGGMDGRLYAVDPKSGEELWSYELGAKFSASPAISRGVLVISGEDGVVYAFASE